MDSPPKISYKDELSFIMLYVSENRKPAERFMFFLENSDRRIS